MPWSEVDSAQVKLDPICIIGAGPAGLITAHVLLRDGFQNVQVLSKDSCVGGVWAKGRVYPTMKINNVHGQFRFSSLAMPPPPNSESTGGRLSGDDISRYMEEFYERFLCQDPGCDDDDGRPRNTIVRFNTEVLHIRRGPSSQGWSLLVRDTISDATETLLFPRIILCTGGCSVPRFPKGLSPNDALRDGYDRPVVHSSQSWASMESILSSADIRDTDVVLAKDPHTGSRPPKIPSKPVVVVGGGKSAQDIAAYLASKNVNVTIVYRKMDMFLAAPKPLPSNIRQSRILSVLWPSITLKTRMERFLHTTWLGSKIVKWFWNRMNERSFTTYSIPKESPLRITHSLFWDCCSGDEGVRRDDSYHAFVMQGKINVIAPAHVSRFEGNGSSAVVLSTGEKLEAAAVVVATGYGSSWDQIFDNETASEIGLTQMISPAELERYSWDYLSLQNPPASDSNDIPPGPLQAPGLYQGLVPANSIERRDIAVNGAFPTGNTGYSFEVCAHWISAYFLGEKLRLPKTVEEAKEDTLRQLAWMKRRYPSSSSWANPSFASLLSFLSWPQMVDDLLEDMYLPSIRSGGNWLTWLLKPITSNELETLGEERRRKRGEAVLKLSSPSG